VVQASRCDAADELVVEGAYLSNASLVKIVVEGQCHVSASLVELVSTPLRVVASSAAVRAKLRAVGRGRTALSPCQARVCVDGWSLPDDGSSRMCDFGFNDDEAQCGATSAAAVCASQRGIVTNRAKFSSRPLLLLLFFQNTLLEHRFIQ
jgi:hypothetical protein